MARGRADHAAGELLRYDITPAVNFEQDGQYQAIQVRAKRTLICREFNGKHRYGAIREINTGSSQHCFTVDRGAGTNVVTDVRNMNLERVVAALEPIHPDGVVKIASVAAVDRDQRQMAQISSPVRANWKRCFGFGYRRCPGEQFTIKVFEDFLRKVWADKIEFRKLDILDPERVPIGPGHVTTDDLGFSYSA